MVVGMGIEILRGIMKVWVSPCGERKSKPASDVCKDRPKQTIQEQKKSKSEINKIQAYILTRVSWKRRQATIKNSEVEALGKGLSEKLLEAADELWKVGKISRYREVEGGVWIWIGM